MLGVDCFHSLKTRYALPKRRGVRLDEVGRPFGLLELGKVGGDHWVYDLEAHVDPTDQTRGSNDGF